MRDVGDPRRIAWHVGPVPVRLPCVPICRAKPGVKLRFTLLSGIWQAVRVHNIERRDTPCLGEKCPHLFDGFHRSSLLKWYTDGFSWQTKRVCLVEATEGAMAPYLSDVGAVAPMRRGQAVELSRDRPVPHARGILLILPAESDPNILPPSFDVQGALLNNWIGDTKRS